MKLQINRPIVVIDLETTGPDRVMDRIVEIAILKVFKDGSTALKSSKLNPIIRIRPDATAIHGITNEQVTDCPTFHSIAENIYNYLSDCDVVGFNSNRFDIPMLIEEFSRSGIEWPEDGTRFIDVQTIFHKKEERTLSAAVKFYLGREHEGAHGAVADVEATWEVLQSQLDRYVDIPVSVDELSEFSKYGNMVDFSGMLEKNEKGEVVFRFGKWKGQPVINQLDYAKWIIGQNFPSDTKRILKRIIEESENPMFAGAN